MINKYETNISQFMVHTPSNKMEEQGEILYLSRFGEYCPSNSIRGYSLFHLITHPENYSIKTIIDQGKKIEIIPTITAQTKIPKTADSNVIYTYDGLPIPYCGQLFHRCRETNNFYFFLFPKHEQRQKVYLKNDSPAADQIIQDLTEIWEKHGEKCTD